MTETTAAGALADTTKLSDFEGLPVRQAAIEIPGAAGGLRDAMRIDPQEFRKGQRVYVVMELDCAKIRFDPIDRAELAGDQRRVHVFDVLAEAIVDRELVEPALAEQKRRIELAKEAAAGVGRLPMDDEAENAHDDGLHASGLVPGCPKCDAEVQAQNDEAAGGAAPEPPTPAPTPIAGRAKKAAKRAGRPSS